MENRNKIIMSFNGFALFSVKFMVIFFIFVHSLYSVHSCV